VPPGAAGLGEGEEEAVTEVVVDGAESVEVRIVEADYN